MNAFLVWWRAATRAERLKLAELTRTSVAYLRSHLINGRRPLTAEWAARIEEGAREVAEARPVGIAPLPAIPRGAICETCAQCPHYLRRVEADRDE